MTEKTPKVPAEDTDAYAHSHGTERIKNDLSLRRWIERGEKDRKAAQAGNGPFRKVRRLNDGGDLVCVDIAGKSPSWRLDYTFPDDDGVLQPKGGSLGTVARL